MINLPKTITTAYEAQQYLLNNFSVAQLTMELAELLLSNRKPEQITVTEEQMEYINSFFKVRGKRTIDGVEVKETRGRKPKYNGGNTL